MIEVKAFMCEYCGKIHTSIEDAELCTANCKATKEEQEKVNLAEAEKKELLNFPRLNAGSFEDLTTLTKNVVAALYQIEVNFKFTNLIFNEKARNTNSRPVNGVTNFNYDKNLPRGYPGFVGRIEGTFKVIRPLALSGNGQGSNSVLSPMSLFSSSLHLSTSIRGINSGSGGGRPTFSYDVTLFLDDFPIIKEKFLRYKESKSLAYTSITKLNEEYSEKVRLDPLVKDFKQKLDLLVKKRNKVEKEISEVCNSSATYALNTYYTERDEEIREINGEVEKFNTFLK